MWATPPLSFCFFLEGFDSELVAFLFLAASCPSSSFVDAEIPRRRFGVSEAIDLDFSVLGKREVPCPTDGGESRFCG